jgi:hypothetical protein
MAAVRNRIPTRAGHFHQADIMTQPGIRNTSDDLAIKRPRSIKPWAILITLTIIALSFLIIWTTVVTPWWSSVQDQWQYGSSRITQIDANVGHDGESHFIAEYYRGAIVVIEIPYANTNDTHTYTIPGIAGDGSNPVVLLSTTKDTQTGRLDLVVSVAGTNFETVLFNTGSAFNQEQN